MKNWKITSAICASLSVLALPGVAAPVADVLNRPSLNVAKAAQATLLGAAMAGNRLVAVGERGIVILSDDQGRSWRQASVPVSVTLTAVRMVNSDIGYAVGHSGVVLTTTDGGANWRKLTDGAQLALAAQAEARATGNPQAIQAAELLVADGADKPLLDLHFTDARHGLIVGAANLALMTDDGGITWQSIAGRLDNPRALHLYTARVRGKTVLIAGEQGVVYLSRDACRSFKRISTPYSGSYFTAELLADDVIVLAGLRGNIWRSTDGGSQWHHIASPSPASFVSSALSGTQGAILANQSGQIYALEGDSAALLPISVAPPLAAVQPIGQGRWLALGGQGAVIATVPEQGVRK